MVRRTGRTEMPPDPAGIVRALRVCHDALTAGVLMKTVPFGPTYKLALAILTAIDGLADHLTGKDGYFRATGSAPSDGARQELHDRLAREKGEKPWQE